MRYLLLLALLQCGLANSQPIKLSTASFSTGDKAEWSKPEFADAGWKTIEAGRNWETVGFNGYDGFGWYRFHVNIPQSIKIKSVWKDSLRINLARIDDADEVYLNGKLISKNGKFPSDPGGYQSNWEADREIHLSTADPLIHWDQENVIAVRVYDGGGAGGIFNTVPFISMMDLIDGVSIRFRDTEVRPDNKINTPVVITNRFTIPVTGILTLRVTETETGKVTYNQTKKVTISVSKNLVAELGLPNNKRQEIYGEFIEEQSGKMITALKIMPYILTPPVAATPRINGAKVAGVRPGSPFLYKIAATGDKPLQYAVDQLPAGLKLDAATGIISGTIAAPGVFNMNITVKNDKGSDTRAFTIKAGKELALTPPMGWNSWNCWGLSVSDEKVKSSAQAMIDKGLADHGWTYINIDDGWEAEKRNAQGQIVTNNKFPDMKGLGDWLHKNGLKFGIYSSPGPRTCGGFLGSWQHEKQDAVSYANWGIDYLKYDWCSYGDLPVAKDTSLAGYMKPYKMMQGFLREQKRDIVYSLCQYGMKDVWKWGADVDGNCWRTTGDITDTWNSLYGIGFSQTVQYPYAKPGRWNDPDMLIVGQVGWGESLHPTRLTPDEQYTHISLWCLLSSPLLIGCDISKLDDFTLNLLSNDEVIALDQDPLGKQAKQVLKTEGYQIWMKELEDGSKAVGIFNLTDSYNNITVKWADLGLNGKNNIRDLWRQKDLGPSSTEFSTKVSPHGVILLKVSE